MSIDLLLPRAALLAAFVALVSGCSSLRGGTATATAITVEDLKIDATAYPALDHLEVQTAVVDRDPADPNAPGMILMLRELGIRSSANYRVWLRAEPHPIIVKARINVFTDAGRAAAELAKRFGPEARAQSSRLDLGDEAFNLQDRLVVMRIDRVNLEFILKGRPDRLMSTAEAYERFVRARLEQED
jgi:hypothetical protein